VLDVVTRGILVGKCTRQDDERRDIVGLQGDGGHAIGDVGDVTNGTLMFTSDHLDTVSDFDRILSVSRPDWAVKGWIWYVSCWKEWANIQRSTGNGDARGREVLEDETRLVCLVAELIFFLLFWNVLDVLAPHHLDLVCSPLAQFQVTQPFVFCRSQAPLGNARKESGDHLCISREIVIAHEAYISMV
jgi:hypothetical protein